MRSAIVARSPVANLVRAQDAARRALHCLSQRQRCSRFAIGKDSKLLAALRQALGKYFINTSNRMSHSL
ncbi:hypothetical protein D918_07447 [Trichuris suis]|nr:hypothetical protein D918_07447 [Trichuris suis]